VLKRLLLGSAFLDVTRTPQGAYRPRFGNDNQLESDYAAQAQTAMQNGAVNPQTSYDFAYTYPAPGSAHPHGATAIGGSTVTNDANGNQINTLTGTSDQSQYLYDEENRLSCANKGPQTPSPSCNAQGTTSFIYDHAGVRKVKTQSSPVIYPNQYYTDFGGGAGNQFKHIFVAGQRPLTKKARVAPGPAALVLPPGPSRLDGNGDQREQPDGGRRPGDASSGGCKRSC
jgi:hypothetical protein